MKKTIASIFLISLFFLMFSTSDVIGQKTKKLYPVSNGTKYGLVNAKKKQIVDYIYDYIFPFKYGLAIFMQDSLFGVVNYLGEEVIQPEYDKIQLAYEDYFIVRRGDSANIFDFDGNQLCHQWHYQIEPAGGNYFRLKKLSHKGSQYIKETIRHYQLENIIGLARDSVYFSEFLIGYYTKDNRLLDNIWFSGGEQLEDGKFKVAISRHTYFLDTLGGIMPRDADPCDRSLMNIFRPDEAPVFPGGYEAWSTFLQNNIHYPDNIETWHHNVQVVVSFVIDKEGNGCDLQVVKSVDPVFDSMVINGLRDMPRWTPAKYNGEPVCFEVEFPFGFSVQGY
jgi:hypothetical protein